MNRDEILAKSRAEKEDEGMYHAKARANSWGIAVMGLICTSVYLYDLFCHNPINYPVYSILSAYTSVYLFSMFLYEKRKIFLFNAVLAAITAATTLACYFLGR